VKISLNQWLAVKIKIKQARKKEILKLAQMSILKNYLLVVCQLGSDLTKSK